MKPVMKVTVLERGRGFEGLVQMPNLLVTRLKKEDRSTLYTTVSNLRQAAVSAAKKYNVNLIFNGPKKVAVKKEDVAI